MLRRFTFWFIIIALALAALRMVGWDYLTAQWNALAALMGGYGLLAGGLAMGLGAFAFAKTRQNRVQNQREINEAMRTLKHAKRTIVTDEAAMPDVVMTAPQQSNGGLEVASAKTAPVTLTVQQAKPTTPSNAQKGSAKKSAGAKKPKLQIATSSAANASEIGQTLYFQPNVAIDDGTVAGYEVYLRASNHKTKRHAFVQYQQTQSKQLRVRAELTLFERVASETRRVLQSGSDGTKSGLDGLINVPVSRALLCDDPAIKSVMNLYRAHPALKSAICLNVDGGSLRGDQKPLLVAFGALNRAGIPLSLNFSSAGASSIGDDLLKWFDTMTIAKGMVQNAVMAVQERSSSGDTNPQKEAELRQANPTLRLIDWMIANKRTIIARDIVCEADIVDMLSEGITIMSGEMFGDPRPIKTDLVEIGQNLPDNLHLNIAG